MKNLFIFQLIFVLTFCFHSSFSKQRNLKTLLEEADKHENSPCSLLTALLSVDDAGRTTLPSESEHFATIELIDKILRKVDLLTSGDYSKAPDFANHVHKIQAVEEALKKANEDGGGPAARSLHRACNPFLAMDSARWIHSEIAQKNHRHSFKVFEAISQEREFLMFSVLAILVQAKAAVLGEVCLSAMIKKHPELSETLGRYRRLNEQLFDSTVTLTKEEVPKVESEIGLRDAVKSYVADYARRNLNQSNNHVVRIIREHMADKYCWRNWAVISYNGKSILGVQEYLHGNVNHSIKIEGSDIDRTVIVTSIGLENLNAVLLKYEDCKRKTMIANRDSKQGFGCFELVEAFRSCYGEGYKELLCVSRDLDMEARGYFIRKPQRAFISLRPRSFNELVLVV